MNQKRTTHIPDPATIYERAKPAEQSPGGALDGPRVRKPHVQDRLQSQNEGPSTRPSTSPAKQR